MASRRGLRVTFIKYMPSMPTHQYDLLICSISLYFHPLSSLFKQKDIDASPSLQNAEPNLIRLLQRDGLQRDTAHTTYSQSAGKQDVQYACCGQHKHCTCVSGAVWKAGHSLHHTDCGLRATGVLSVQREERGKKVGKRACAVVLGTDNHIADGDHEPGNGRGEQAKAKPQGGLEIRRWQYFCPIAMKVTSWSQADSTVTFLLQRPRRGKGAGAGEADDDDDPCKGAAAASTESEAEVALQAQPSSDGAPVQGTTLQQAQPGSSSSAGPSLSFYERTNPHKPSALPSLTASTPRRYTVSIALPGSIVLNAQTPELQSRLAGQIARSCAIFNVDEIIVFDEGRDEGEEQEQENSGYPQRNRKRRFDEDGNDDGFGAPVDGAGDVDQQPKSRFDPNAFLARILQYVETPQCVAGRLLCSSRL